MKIILLLVLFSIACSSPQNIEVNLIPQPKTLELKTGVFNFNASTGIWCDTLFEDSKNYLLEISPQPLNGHKNIIALCYKKGMSEEEYQMKINTDSIIISATTTTAMARGIQTLRQLLPIHKKKANIPALYIHDYPQFPWRGLLLDCSRHFMDLNFVKRYIDLLAYHKMNVLHWHITEDQGWRIAIDSYPKLTQIGAWRTQKDGTKYGGFYSKEDIKSLVKYASQRHITIVPEIELPGHSIAALAAYPHLSCTGGPFEVENDWGVFKDIYCAGNDSVFEFLEHVLDEVLEMFPSKYIHIGGDEAPKYRWENCSKCQERMHEEKLHDSHQLQSYFIKRIEQYLNQKGRSIIGWDEILEGGLAPTATVQSWRGMDGGIEAAKKGNYAIMSPTSHAYFDYDLDAIDLQKVYSFDPIPSALTPEEAPFILGGECNMWTERAPQELVDSKVFPRLLAMAEVLWSYPQKDYPQFYNRVQKHYPRLEALGVDYGYESIPITSHCTFDQQHFNYQLFSASSDISIEYRLNQSEWKSYTQPLKLSESTLIEARGFKNGKAYGTLSQQLHKHLALGKKMYYSTPYSPNYPAKGPVSLNDGILGSSEKFRDGNWQGFFGTSLDVTIDLDSITKIKELQLGCFQYNLSWIMMPKNIRIYQSSDGENFRLLNEWAPQISPKKEGRFREDFIISCNTSSRFIKVQAEHFGLLPQWHPAAGSQSWLFVDEIMIR